MGRSARVRSAPLDRLLVAVTRAASYSRLWMAIAGVLVAAGGRPGRRAAARGLISVGLAAALANGPAKLLVRRRRPPRRLVPTLIPMPRSTSFPSGHSASAFAFATGVCTELPALTGVLVPLAAAVAYSRTHAGVHYPSDVVAGIAIGVGSGMLTGKALSATSRQRRSPVGARKVAPSQAPRSALHTHSIWVKALHDPICRSAQSWWPRLRDWARMRRATAPGLSAVLRSPQRGS